MEGITAEVVNKGKFKTFAHGYVTSGDIVYVPFCHVFCEKATSAHNVSLRSPCMMLNTGNEASAEVLKLAYQEPLD